MFSTSHIHLCKARAGGKRNFVCSLTEIFPWIFAIYRQYLAFLRFEDGAVYHFKISGCRSCSFCNSLNRCLSFTFLLYY